MEKHLIIQEDTKQRLYKIKIAESAAQARNVTWDELLNQLAGVYEEGTAGVEP